MVIPVYAYIQNYMRGLEAEDNPCSSPHPGATFFRIANPALKCRAIIILCRWHEILHPTGMH